MQNPITFRRAAVAAILFCLGLLSIGQAQEACLKGCAYPPYPGLLFTLGDGFVAKGGEEIKVTHMGFLGSVYNNDGITPRKVGVPNYIGELSVIDPITGLETVLFRNQLDWITHANDSGKVISLGVFPKGAPVVFKYVNVDGKEKSYKTFARYSGDNIEGIYDFNADPVLKTLAINGKPKPVSGGTWNWEGKNYNLWCVAADVPGTGEKQFQFEDADDRIFNDIVFRVSGVALVSETHQLAAPVITSAKNADETYRVTLALQPGEINAGATVFYTTDGSVPAFDSTTSLPKAGTKVYTDAINITQSATVKARTWKPSVGHPSGGVIRYVGSPVAEASFTITRRKLATPTANPPGGIWSVPITVSLAQANGAKIHFRLCDPGAACPDPDGSSQIYAGAIALTGPKVIKAIAILAPNLNSDVGTFTFTPGKWKTPTANPAGGGFTGTLSVTLSQPEGAKVYFVICDAGATCPAPTTASTAYSAPFALTGAKTVKAIAIQAPLENSDLATWVFTPTYIVAEAWYLDRDGDGRIESARILMGGGPAAFPTALALVDPFQKGSKRNVAAAGMSWESPSHDALLATFPPFTAGTGFAAGQFGSFPNAENGYTAGAWTVKDGAGPVAIRAEARISLDSGSIQKLRVRWSEPLQSPGANGSLPFRIKRGGEEITVKLLISGVEKIGDVEYEYAFSSPLFPVPGDSLTAAPTAKDAPGNASAMAVYIVIGGAKPVLKLRLSAEGGGCRRGRALSNPRPVAIPVSVIAPRSADRSVACADGDQAPVCLDCLTREWKAADPRRYDADALPPGPEIRITTQGPFRFDLAFFNTAGEFVNRAQGQVSAAMLQAVAADARGNRTVSLQWYPVSEQGHQAASGAYIAKGTLTLSPDGTVGSLPELPFSVVAAVERVQIRFGYLRD